MPELPEVETMVRGIRPYLEGRTIVTLERCRCPCKPIALSPSLRTMRRHARGRKVEHVRRVAKRVVLELDSHELFVIEPRMTGLMLLSDPPDRDHLRLRWRLAGRRKYNSVWFWDRRGLGTVRLLKAREFDAQLGMHKIGPDALEITDTCLQARCAETGRAVKIALMDQSFVGGIGNLYASEILHRAGLHPARPANQLSRRNIQNLHGAIDSVLEEAIRYEGSTLGDGTYRNALSQSGRYQNVHRVYRREHERCISCRESTIVKVVQAQRSTFFCPHCQR